MPSPTATSILSALTHERILDLARVFGAQIRPGAGARAPQKRHLAGLLGAQLTGRLGPLLEELGRDELVEVCRVHELDLTAIASTSVARGDLIVRVLEAAGLDPKRSVPPPPAQHLGGLPTPGQVVRARHRQWLVEGVEPGAAGESALVKLSCLDDDDPGRALSVLWDLELGAEIIVPEQQGLGKTAQVDTPPLFGAYLSTLRWNTVSAADATRFQAPFRAGIQHMAHQLTPLMKALELPRANLFIADDVGLGKTIEAGLVLQELILRQQADFVLIACPASICLQWQGEMRRRFGLSFEVMTKTFVAHRRQQRGFGVNPWATHNRFIVSHHLLRRPEYTETLRRHLGDRAPKSLLILDEAHVAAPATRSRYAVDSEITRTIRDLGPRFDNRLFLSATPHNGHSNSFSALLELLDPIRFDRGVPISGMVDLAPVMVRRLKRDLKKLGIDNFPERVLVQIELTHDAGGWHATSHRSDAKDAPSVVGLGEGPPLDLELAEMLARFTELCAPKNPFARRPFIRLQQRLLSSPEAFARSLETFANSLEKKGGVVARPQQLELDDAVDTETYGETDEALQAAEDRALADGAAKLPSPTEEARALLGDLRGRAERARRQPDAKVRALSAWIREHMCPGFGLGEPAGKPSAWADKRLLIFTEWADTKRYLVDLLNEAARATDRGEERIQTFHGGMGDDAREQIQQAFNADPSEQPLRILVATDAAREGINLQAHCADVFHIDLPWNPARLEQRNGRIDRALQPSPEVRCHYFIYPARPEDRVLEALVRKVDIVQRELGSLGAVLFDDIEQLLEGGIDKETVQRIQAVDEKASRRTVDAELESARKDEKLLRAEINRSRLRYEESKKALWVSPESLVGVVDVGLRLAGTQGLVADGITFDKKPQYRLPDLDRSWEITLDSIRPPRTREQSFWDWRNVPPRPVTFTPVARLTSEVEQLHLAHPVVRRVLDRFLAQGFSAHDLSRVCGLVAPDDAVIRVIAYARLSLFGPGAARLHDELVAVAAPWDGAPDSAAAIAPYTDGVVVAKAIAETERLLAIGATAPGKVPLAAIQEGAGALFAALWGPLEIEADARAVLAKNGLGGRARKEADDLRVLLERQKGALRDAIGGLQQGELFTEAKGKTSPSDEHRQVLLTLDHMQRREASLDTDLEREPRAIAALYDVRMTRLSPVGLVVSWPGVGS